MLNSIMQNHLLLYGIAALTLLGSIWLLMVNAFFDRIIRDMQRMEKPRGSWMKSFTESYQIRLMQHQKITNAEAFIRTQLSRGKSFGVFVYRLKRWSGYCGLTALLLAGAGVYLSFLYEYESVIRYRYLMAGVISALILLLLRPFLCFGQKEDMILDGLMDYMENQAVEEPVREETRVAEIAEDYDSLAAQVTEGIRQTAASSSRFAQMLTPEEERIMREVIKEYLT